jgi:DNA polymerase-3 subunit epsilon
VSPQELPDILPPFVAIDFETASRHADSACSIGLVRVEDGQITQRAHYLIKPPRNDFEHAWVHGITHDHVKHAPDFAGMWPDVAPLFDGVAFAAAHNAGFDKKVLHTCLTAAGLPVPTIPFHCTVKLARHTWQLHRANLKAVCQLLGIALRHHDAGSDAEACARIVLAAHAHAQQRKQEALEQLELAAD